MLLSTCAPCHYAHSTLGKGVGLLLPQDGLNTNFAYCCRSRIGCKCKVAQHSEACKWYAPVRGRNCMVMVESAAFSRDFSMAWVSARLILVARIAGRTDRTKDNSEMELADSNGRCRLLATS